MKSQGPWVVCHRFRLVRINLHFVSCGGWFKKVYQDITFAFAAMSSTKRMLVINRSPMLTLPSWLSNVSDIILSETMLKCWWELIPLLALYSCSEEIKIKNEFFHVLPSATEPHSGPYIEYQWLVLYWHWCYISLLMPIRLHAITYQKPSWNLWRHSRDSAEVAMLQVFLAEDQEIKHWLCVATSCLVHLQ